MEKLKNGIRGRGIEWELRYEEFYKKAQAHKQYVANCIRTGNYNKRHPSALSSASKRVAGVFNLVVRKLRRSK